MDKERKDLINKRKIGYVYLMHRMFGGSPVLMIKTMKFRDVTVADLEDWDIDWKEAVYKVIEEEDAHGVKMKDPKNDVPSIGGIKEKALRRIDEVIKKTDDPSRLAQMYKILSEFEGADEKKEKSVLDAINESVKPKTPKQKEKIKTMKERMEEQEKARIAPAEEPEDDGDDLNFVDD